MSVVFKPSLYNNLSDKTSQKYHDGSCLSKLQVFEAAAVDVKPQEGVVNEVVVKEATCIQASIADFLNDLDGKNIFVMDYVNANPESVSAIVDGNIVIKLEDEPQEKEEVAVIKLESVATVEEEVVVVAPAVAPAMAPVVSKVAGKKMRATTKLPK